jgi:DNA-binding transcriptional LysR family regulator
MNISIQQLRTFANIVKHTKLSRAAELMHLTQPALSKQIKLLNEACGEPLFTMKGKTLQLSGLGKSLLPYVEDVLNSYQYLLDYLDKKRLLRVDVLIPPDLADVLLQSFVTLKQTFPEALLNYETLPTQFMHARLEQAGFDLVVSHQPIVSKGYDFLKLGEYRYQLVASPPVKKRLKSASQPKNVVFMMEVMDQKQLKNIEKKIKISLVPMLISNYQSIKKAVLLDFGIALLPEYLITDEIETKKIGIIECEDLKKITTLYLGKAKSVNISVTDALINIIRSNLPSINRVSTNH